MVKHEDERHTLGDIINYIGDEYRWFEEMGVEIPGLADAEARGEEDDFRQASAIEAAYIREHEHDVYEIMWPDHVSTKRFNSDASFCLVVDVEAEPKMTRPTSPEEFEKRTGLVLEVLADAVIMSRKGAYARLTSEQREWFVAHVDLRLRYLHAVRVSFREVLEGSGNRGRDLAIKWTEHWLEAYLSNLKNYQETHSHTLFDEKEVLET